MPVGDIAAGLVEIAGRILAQIFIEIILELLIKGPGYLIIRIIKGTKTNDLDPDGAFVILTGILFWIFIAVIVFIWFKVL